MSLYISDGLCPALPRLNRVKRANDKVGSHALDSTQEAEKDNEALGELRAGICLQLGENEHEDGLGVRLHRLAICQRVT